jgi:hypothetical protein
MKLKVSPQQAFLIYSMLFGTTPEEREPTLKQAPIAAKKREELVKAKLIRKEKREGSRATFLALTSEGHDWAAENLGATLVPTKRAGRVLQSVLSLLRAVVQGDTMKLSTFAAGITVTKGNESARRAATPVANSVGETAGIEARIRSAYFGLTRGAAKQRVLLKDLRPQVNAPRNILDVALLELQRQQKLVLMMLDNPSEVTPADEAAALHIAGHARHLLYFQA